jgi:putative acetyltransferase
MQILEHQIKNGDAVADLVGRHLEEMSGITPSESVHALSSESLMSPDLTFWAAWERDALIGCGGLRALDPECGEVKSMHTVAEQRGKGVASRILSKMTEEASRRGYRRLLLETGSSEEFAGARAFYEHHGFALCGPFGDYRLDPNSVFMSKEL